jgi:CRISPR-associated protein Csx17
MTATMITRHILPGLRGEPLASYLAGLGLIRVLGEQADRAATAAWTPDGLAVTTAVPDIAAWLAEEYVPTPVLSPWNNGSGFGAKDREPIRRLEALRAHPSPRLNAFKNAIALAGQVVRDAREAGWISGKAGEGAKGRVVLEFRNRCPDALLPWIDASVVLAGEDTFFPPLLGTGGNDGRLDFSTNFHEQVLAVIGATASDRARSRDIARDLLSGTQAEQLADVPIGQFDPGNAGGPGSSRFGAASSLANAWGYVLVVEGALMFAASVVRRNHHAAGRAAMPFTVFGSPDGSPSGAAGEESRGEVWAPVWTRDFTLGEIRQLFAEARASWRGRPARRAVDFYAATRTLGVARGIEEFSRFGLQRRNGLAFAAVPLDRIRVQEKPAVQLAAKVEDWVSRVGGSDASTMVGERLRQFNRAHLEFARDGDADTLTRMLAALTTLEQAVGRSVRAREAVPVRYVPPAGEFLKVLVDRQSRELRLAVGIASCATGPADGPPRTMRQLLLPVDHDRWRDAPLIPGFGTRPLCDVLADVLIWRSRTAVEDRDAAKFRGVRTFRSSIAVPAADLHTLAKSGGDGYGLDEKKLELLLRACLALNWHGVRHEWTPARPDFIDFTLGLLHPLASGFRPPASDNGAADEPGLALAPGWAIQLVAGKLSHVRAEAVSRLRQVGWDAGPAHPELAVGDGTRIAAALVPRCLCPQSVLTMLAVEIKTKHETHVGMEL